MYRLCLLLSIVVLMASGCDAFAPKCEIKPSLVDHQLWTLVPVESDPLMPPVRDAGSAEDAGLTPDERIGRCGPPEINFEDFGQEPAFSVQTSSRCHWVTVEQPLLEAVKKGEELTTRVWYFSQSAFGETEGKLQLAFGDEVIWTKSVPLPTESGLVFSEFPSPVDAPAGTQVRWGLSNHGSNSWHLLELSLTRLEVCPNDGGAQ